MSDVLLVALGVGLLGALLVGVVVLGLARARRLARLVDETLARGVEGLGLTLARVRGRLYAYGPWERTWLTVRLHAQRAGLGLALLVRMKVPGTQRVALWVQPRPSGGALHRAAGWHEIEPGFLLGRVPGSPGARACEPAFRRLSVGTKAALLDLAGRHASVVLSVDWDTVMLGRPDALFLAGGREDVRACLDLQAILPAGAGTGARDALLRELRSLADRVERDFAAPFAEGGSGAP